jgi:tetratricopeptide (TPR) repeat protein
LPETLSGHRSFSASSGVRFVPAVFRSDAGEVRVSTISSGPELIAPVAKSDLGNVASALASPSADDKDPDLDPPGLSRAPAELADTGPAVLSQSAPANPQAATPKAMVYDPELVTTRLPSVTASPQPQLLPPPAVMRLPPVLTPVRSEALERIARQADRQVYHGFELAGRGAYFAARAEFTSALRLVAQGLDTEQRTTDHSRALSAGLTAMKEAQDFLPSGTKLEADLDLSVIVGSHTTPVLKTAVAEELRPMSAVKAYFTYAQEQLAAAVGHEVAGSMALCALGKLHSILASQKFAEIQACEPKAIVFLQASILVYPGNYMASNDLGVLFAHAGDYVAARRCLEHSISIYRGASNLGNLAVVYQQLGERQLAGMAVAKAHWARQAETARLMNTQGSATGVVEWVSPPAMAQSAGQWTSTPQQPSPTGAARSGQPTTTAMDVRSNR